MKIDFAKELKILTELTNYVQSSVTISFCGFTKTKILNMISNLNALIIDKNDQVNDDMGEVSDGYHTFNELYHHRAILFSVICNNYPHLAWKSLKHHDPNQPMYDNMFIVGIDTPEGQATYHYDITPYWDMFKVTELEKAPEWDGHTPDDAIKRIASLPIINTNQEYNITDMLNDVLNF